MSSPRLSVIIPAYNAGNTLPDCLAALERSLPSDTEVIIVDDGSSDGSIGRNAPANATVIRMGNGPRGPAAARNRGAESARGEILIFLDADVAVHDDTLKKIDDMFRTHPEIDALFGSYDDNPSASGWISRYKNLLHHSVHQHGNRKAFTFWAGCGAVRREIFHKSGGFDESFVRPSIEDIELGYRMCGQGRSILLCPEIQVIHLKRWTFRDVVLTDIVNRAVPWTRLILKEKKLPADLNLNVSSRFSALIVWIILGSVITGFFNPWIWLVLPLAMLLLWLLNRDIYGLFLRKGGVLFFIDATMMHAFYLFYSSAVFGIIGVETLLSRMVKRKRPAPESDPVQERHT